VVHDNVVPVLVVPEALSVNAPSSVEQLAPPVPVPLRAEVWVPALSVTVKVPVNEPDAVG
jgi:hypothetical protein